MTKMVLPGKQDKGKRKGQFSSGDVRALKAAAPNTSEAGATATRRTGAAAISEGVLKACLGRTDGMSVSESEDESLSWNCVRVSVGMRWN